MKFRIEQVGENTFRPQVRTSFLYGWGCIDRYDSHVWYTYRYHADHNSFEEASKTIERFKNKSIEAEMERKKYPKYFYI